MKTVLHLSRKSFRVGSVVLVALFALATIGAHAEERSSVKSSNAKELKRFDQKTKALPKNSQIFKRANTNSKACAKSGGKNGAIGGLAVPGGVKTCSGVAACNEFIAECIANGGEFYPDEDKDDPNSGAPTAGACVTSTC